VIPEAIKYKTDIDSIIEDWYKRVSVILSNTILCPFQDRFVDCSVFPKVPVINSCEIGGGRPP